MVRLRLGIAIGAAVILTGCGSSGNTAAPFKPEGGNTAAPTTAASTPAPSLVSFPFGAGVHFTFQSSLPADPGQQAAAVADRDFMLSYYYAIYSGGKSTAVYGYIPSQETSVRTDVFNSVSSQKGTTFTGTLLIYRTTVSPTPGGGKDLTVTSCYDSAKQTTLNRSTGKPVPGQNQIPQDNMFLQSDTWAPVKGGWKLGEIVHETYPNGSAKGCYPL
jgi:hypothetical protein